MVERKRCLNGERCAFLPVACMFSFSFVVLAIFTIQAKKVQQFLDSNMLKMLFFIGLLRIANRSRTTSVLAYQFVSVTLDQLMNK